MPRAGKNDYFICKDHVSRHSNSFQILQARDSCRFNHEYTNQQQMNNKESPNAIQGDTESSLVRLPLSLVCTERKEELGRDKTPPHTGAAQQHLSRLLSDTGTPACTSPSSSKASSASSGKQQLNRGVEREEEKEEKERGWTEARAGGNEKL